MMVRPNLEPPRLAAPRASVSASAACLSGTSPGTRGTSGAGAATRRRTARGTRACSRGAPAPSRLPRRRPGTPRTPPPRRLSRGSRSRAAARWRRRRGPRNRSGRRCCHRRSVSPRQWRSQDSELLSTARRSAGRRLGASALAASSPRPQAVRASVPAGHGQPPSAGLPASPRALRI
ncbi:hypothetical protein PVAP13_5NG038424 [Panicum virgatum]|uniref:Uncharacterized protein n=1 Tax=Panicum virgatum TaxID=38727 RepID=A0A8T0RLA6_PANVG|nr:hypothetical protein PVAP13_5NG038424 [Panicum virgatum]